MARKRADSKTLGLLEVARASADLAAELQRDLLKALELNDKLVDINGRLIDWIAVWAREVLGPDSKDRRSAETAVGGAKEFERLVRDVRRLVGARELAKNLNDSKRISTDERRRVKELNEQLEDDYPKKMVRFDQIAERLGLTAHRVRYIIEGSRRKAKQR